MHETHAGGGSVRAPRNPRDSGRSRPAGLHGPASSLRKPDALPGSQFLPRRCLR